MMNGIYNQDFRARSRLGRGRWEQVLGTGRLGSRPSPPPPVLAGCLRNLLLLTVPHLPTRHSHALEVLSPSQLHRPEPETHTQSLHPVDSTFPACLKPGLEGDSLCYAKPGSTPSQLCDLRQATALL